MSGETASPSPRHARLWSVLILGVGVVMGAGGVLVALGRSTTEELLAIGGLLAIGVIAVGFALTRSRS